MSHIQAILFDKKKFDTKAARSWLKKNSMKPIKRVHSTGKYHRYRIREPRSDLQYRIKSIDRGVRAVISFR